MRARWRLFADEWLRTWNATEAYSKAYTKCTREAARRAGQRLLTKVDILDYIHERQMKPEEVIGRLEEQGRSEYHKFINGQGEVDIQAMKDAGKAHLIKGISYDRRGNRIVKFHDGQAALIYIGKHHKLFTDKTEVEIGDKLAAKLDKYVEVANRIYGDHKSGDTGTNSNNGA